MLRHISQTWHDTLQDIPKLEGQLDILAATRDAAGILDTVSYAGYDETGTELQFIPSTTFRDGTVHLGDDSNDPTGRTIFPNNGVRIVMPTRDGHDARVLAVDTVPAKRNRTRPVLTQTYIADVDTDTPSIMSQESEPISTSQTLPIDVAEFGFIKAIRLDESGNYPKGPELQTVIEDGLFNPDQEAEFLLVARALSMSEAYASVA